jgi:hypothetical protein
MIELKKLGMYDLLDYPWQTITIEFIEGRRIK